MELVPDESIGRFYTPTDLKERADVGAKQANETAEGYFVSTEWLTIPSDHTEFVVRCKRATGFAELSIKVEVSYAKNGGIAMRSLSLYGSNGEPSRDETLEPLQLKTDGNPTAFIDDRKLREAELIDELIRPVIEAS